MSVIQDIHIVPSKGSVQVSKGIGIRSICMYMYFLDYYMYTIFFIDRLYNHMLVKVLNFNLIIIPGAKM